MRILIIRNGPDVMEYEEGKYNLQEVGLARAINKLGHKCDVVYSGGASEKTIVIEYAPDKTFNLFYLKVTNILGNGYLHGLNKLVREYDVIQSGAYDQLRSWIMAKKYPDKLLVYQGPYYNEFNKGYNMKCRFVDFLFVPRYKKKDTTFITKSVLAAEFLKQKGINNVTSIGVGFDIEQMESEGILESEISYKLRSLKEDRYKLLLYVGRLEERRNIYFLLEVLKGVVVQGEGNIRLVIIGKGNEDYVESVWKYVGDNNLKNFIIYREQLEQKYLPAVYKLCDIFLLPTKFEIFGMVLLEAMYYGLPVVTTHNGGSSILIENEYNGMIVEESAEVWINTIASLINDEEKAKAMGTAASKKISEEFTWDALADKFIELYNKRLNGK